MKIIRSVAFALVLALMFLPNMGNCKQYVHKTIYGAFPDGIDLKVNSLGEYGYIDVTADYFGADPTGVRDSTQAMQRAINYARDNQLVCYVPSGTYKISDTINCTQNLYERTDGKVGSAEFFPCVLIGAVTPSKPVFLLEKNTLGFTDQTKPKTLIYFWARNWTNPQKSQPNIAFNQVIMNIDFRIEPGNLGAIALNNRGAQGTTVQNCDFEMNDAFCAIMDAPGSGGSMVNLVIRGGSIGLNIENSQPAPTIAHVKMFDQKLAAVMYSGRQALAAVGLYIEKENGPAIVGRGVDWNPFYGQISVVDSIIKLKNPKGSAFISDRSIYIGNTYVYNAAFLLATRELKVAGKVNGWSHIKDYALGITPQQYKGYQYTMPVVVNNNYSKVLENITRDSQAPSQTLLGGGAPGISFNGADVINVKEAPYNAAGDGVADDTLALQKALNSGKTVFLPKGVYLISKTLEINNPVTLLGVAKHLSVVAPHKTMDHSYSPRPLISLVKGVKDVTINFLGFYLPSDYSMVYGVEWAAQGNSTLRDVNFITKKPLNGFEKWKKPQAKKSMPVLHITNGGSGSFYNVYQEDHIEHEAGYKHFVVSNTNGPVNIYQCNPEHASGVANMEIINSKNINIYGLKSEGNAAALLIDKSENINVFSYGGNAAALEKQSLFIIRDSSKVTLTNVEDHPRFSGEGSKTHFAGRGVNPDMWSMVSIENRGSKYATKPLARPVLLRID